jgi:hypothetical protein
MTIDGIQPPAAREKGRLLVARLHAAAYDQIVLRSYPTLHVGTLTGIQSSGASARTIRLFVVTRRSHAIRRTIKSTARRQGGVTILRRALMGASSLEGVEASGVDSIACGPARHARREHTTPRGGGAFDHEPA